MPADLAGAGVIRHLWFTVGAEDPLYLRQCVLRMYWDGRSHPSVEAPVGDFFVIKAIKGTVRLAARTPEPNSPIRPIR